MKPSMLIALIIVLVGGAIFLILPLIVGPGSGFGGKGYVIEEADHISTWNWDGVYEDGAQKQADVEKEIDHLKGLLGKGSIADYDLYVGIASQYELIGDGKSAYNYLSRAISDEPKRGLAYMNMGHLMEEMGAFTTAHKAYDAAVAAEPNNPVYQTARQEFLIHHTTP
jgi:tetratricopeptide (TPR) repeat protein